MDPYDIYEPDVRRHPSHALWWRMQDPITLGFPDLWYESGDISKSPRFCLSKLTSVFAITAALDFTALGDEQYAVYF